MLPFVLQSYPQKVWAKDTSPCCVFLESRVINIGSARDAARAATKRASFESVSMLFMSGRAAIARWGLEKLWHSWLHSSVQKFLSRCLRRLAQTRELTA